MAGWTGMEKVMHTQFHINWIGKQWIMDQVAVYCGLRKNVGTFVSGDRVERSNKHRRAVILSLVAEGFLFREPGHVEYEVTKKAFDRIDPLPWRVDEISIPKSCPNFFMRQHVAGFLKTLLLEMVPGEPDESGSFVLKNPAGPRDQDTDKWVVDNLPGLAAELLDLSASTANLVSLRGESVPLSDLGIKMGDILEDCTKEINRLKMRQEAVLLMMTRVEQCGGWDKFIAGCRAARGLGVVGESADE